jgi:hypothetical protein
MAAPMGERIQIPEGIEIKKINEGKEPFNVNKGSRFEVTRAKHPQAGTRGLTRLSLKGKVKR